MIFTKFGIENYKCFTGETEFDSPSLVNLIIGKNNSGKSSFLNVISNIYCLKNVSSSVKESFTIKLEKNDLDKITAIFDSKDQNYYPHYPPQFDKNDLIGKELKMIYRDRGVFVDESTRYFTKMGRRYFLSFPSVKDYYEGLGNSSKIFIKAERNVVSERNSYSGKVEADGKGLTTSLKYHFSNSKGSRKLITDILKELNYLLEGEEHFTSLRVLEEDSNYTIYLENERGEISLNDMGSGIKTLLLVLYSLKYEETFPRDSLFMFEELENNLHPEIQRRLFNLIYEYAIKNNKRVFITSHSHVAINCFYGKEKTKIYHIEKTSSGDSIIQTVDSDLAKGVILDDLGVKASDLFQSNGIIWVEGPSDRIYINKWLSVVDPSLKENIHYTFMLYGGRLLSHYSASQENDMIGILLTNRNSAIVIDSDVKEEGQKINSTKTRIRDSFEKNDKFCWVTKGREIENYIHEKIVNKRYREESDTKLPQIGIYDDFKDYICSDDPSFECHKVQTAKELDFDKETLDVLDLREKVEQLAGTIRKWNN